MVSPNPTKLNFQFPFYSSQHVLSRLDRHAVPSTEVQSNNSSQPFHPFTPLSALPHSSMEPPALSKVSMNPCNSCYYFTQPIHKNSPHLHQPSAGVQDKKRTVCQGRVGSGKLVERLHEKESQRTSALTLIPCTALLLLQFTLVLITPFPTSLLLAIRYRYCQGQTLLLIEHVGQLGIELCFFSVNIV